MSERELTPDEEAEISRLLADAASPEPMPVEVAGRLDDVLAGLVAEREADAPVIPLRTRRWPQVLVAAAAVSLLGFVGANFVDQLGGSAADMSTAGGAAEVADENDRQSNGGSGEEDGFVTAPTVPQDTAAPDRLPEPLSGGWLAYTSLDDSVLKAASRLVTESGGAYSAKNCSRPTMDADAYEVPVAGDRRAVVLVKRVNRRAAAVYVFPCGQSVVPVATSLVLGIR